MVDVMKSREGAMKAWSRSTRSAQRLWLGLTLVGLTMLVAPTLAAAQYTAREQAAVDAERGRVERRARQEVEALFSRLCPGRCELVDLKTVMEEPEPVGEIAPGFENITQTGFEAKAKRLDVRILLDSKMPNNFRSNMPRLIQYRLQGLAPTVNVSPEQLEFPEPQLAPIPPMPEEPKAEEPKPKPPEPKAEEPKEKEEPKEEPKLEEPKDQTPWWQKALAALAKELLPWIPFLITILIMGSMLLYLMRRLREIESQALAGAGQGGEDGRPGTPQPPDADELRAQLERSRSIQNQVLRRWMLDDPSAVAALIAMVGPQVLSDLKGDTSLRPALQTISELLEENPEPSVEEQQKVARDTRARLTAARVLHEQAGMDADWEFLGGASVGNLRRVMRSLPPSELSFVVGKLPPALRASYLERLGPRERRELFVNTSSGELLNKEGAIALARKLRRGMEELSHLSGEAAGQAQIVAEMLAALSLPEQRETLRELVERRPEVSEVVLGQFLLETVALHAPSEALADAMYRTPLERLAQFMRATSEPVRDHMLQQAPGNMRNALQQELGLEIPVSRGDYLEAREEFTHRLAMVLRREGIELQPLNLSALRDQPAPSGGSDPDSTQEVSA